MNLPKERTEISEHPEGTLLPRFVLDVPGVESVQGKLTAAKTFSAFLYISCSFWGKSASIGGYP